MITTTDNNAAEQLQDATDDDVLTLSRQLIDQNKVAYEALGKKMTDACTDSCLAELVTNS